MRSDTDTTLLLTQGDVTQLLSMTECIEVMAEALCALGRKESVLPIRSTMTLPDGRGLLGIMPAHLGAERVLGLKAITVFPGNHGTRYDSHQGVVLLFEAERGRLRSVIDATAITAIRTAAVSAVATRALAEPDAAELAILGSGVQAAAHLDAIRAVRPIRRVRVWSRNPEHARRFASAAAARTGIAVEASDSARVAVGDAAIICTVTSSREPVLQGSWIAPGAHVNAVGACVPGSRELDTEAIRQAHVYVDHRPAALVEAGDLLIPIREGAITESHIAGEIGDLLAGSSGLGPSPGGRTVFKSLGLGIEDLAAACRVDANARAAGVGMPLDLGGYRPASA